MKAACCAHEAEVARLKREALDARRARERALDEAARAAVDEAAWQ